MSQKAIFLDRDDTLIDDPGYINHPDQVKLLDGVPNGLKAFHLMGYKLVLVTNQSAIARGIITEQQLQTIHDRLEYLLAQQGTHLDSIYYCPYHVDGTVSKFAKASDMRKPNPGMILKAAKDMKLDVKRSWCIGDKLSDVEAGHRAGCRTILISATSPVSNSDSDIQPDFIAVNLREAVNIVKQQQNVPAPEKESKPKQEKPKQSPPKKDPEPKLEELKSSAPPITKKQNKKGPASKQVPPKKQAPPPQEPTTEEDTLKAILEQLRAMERRNMFTEFSMFRLIAGIIQVAVAPCLVIAIWLLLGEERQYDAVLVALGFGLLFQMMSLTFFIIRSFKSS